MMTFLVTLHILVCVILVVLVLIQDSKGGGIIGAQSTSNSLLGATGATTLAGTMTKVMAGLLGITCILIAIATARSQKSVVDGGVMNAPAAATATTAPETQPADAAATPATGEATNQATPAPATTGQEPNK